MANAFTTMTIILLVFLSIGGLYIAYEEEIQAFLSNNPERTMFIDSNPVFVTIADDFEERKQGLSGVKRLDELEGKLFIFDEEGIYGIWMKDMNFPIDIIWINNELRVVHIEEDVHPDTYPHVFKSDEPARFVLETNAFFADSFKIKEGDKVTLPTANIPKDLQP